MKMKLHAKEDGLWLELQSSKRKNSALIRIGPETKTPQQKGTIIDTVSHEIWAEIKLEERRKKITDLSDATLHRQISDLSRQFEHETKWLLEEILERWLPAYDEDDGE